MGSRNRAARLLEPGDWRDSLALANSFPGPGVFSLKISEAIAPSSWLAPSGKIIMLARRSRWPRLFRLPALASDIDRVKSAFPSSTSAIEGAGDSLETDSISDG